MKKIAFITERDINSTKNGSSMRDIRLIEILREKYEVDIYHNNVEKSKLNMFRCFRALPKEISNVIESEKYEKVIVSTFIISPFFLSYAKNNKIIYYLCDSSFHIASQFLTIKSKILSKILSFKELCLLGFYPIKAAYLGNDEIRAIPQFIRSKAIIFPFHADINKCVFDSDGHITFIGDFSFLPNKKALNNIIDYAVHSKNKFKIFGSNIPKNLKCPPNVELVGYVDDLEDAYKGAKALIYPVVYGTGVKNKVIEAMSYGIPVVGYKEAFTNLNFPQALIVDSESNFSDDYFVNLKNNSEFVHEFLLNELSRDTVSKIIYKEIDG